MMITDIFADHFIKRDRSYSRLENTGNFCKRFTNKQGDFPHQFNFSMCFTNNHLRVPGLNISKMKEFTDEATSTNGAFTSPLNNFKNNERFRLWLVSDYIDACVRVCLPCILPLFIKPSYWRMSNCVSICCSVSRITPTMIKSDVPPKKFAKPCVTPINCAIPGKIP